MHNEIRSSPEPINSGGVLDHNVVAVLVDVAVLS